MIAECKSSFKTNIYSTLQYIHSFVGLSIFLLKGNDKYGYNACFIYISIYKMLVCTQAIEVLWILM